jgi:hypothetical protein
MNKRGSLLFCGILGKRLSGVIKTPTFSDPGPCTFSTLSPSIAGV